MLDRTFLAKVAREVATGQHVSTMHKSGLKYKLVKHAGTKLLAVEQNPKTNSEWANLARTGHTVVQFKDVIKDKFVAVSVDGDVKLY